MKESSSGNPARAKKKWNDHANGYDEWYESLEGAVEHYVDWQLLKEYLPQNRDAKILDAAGGTGRITLPLARMGYSVTLCDISPAMLNVARRKLVKERVSDKVDILECDVCNLRFADESFDFVLCWDGMVDSAKELIRVTKKGGRLSIFLANKCRQAIDRFLEDPALALALAESGADHLCLDEEKHRGLSPDEATEFVEAEGIRVIDIYAVCGWLDMFPIPKKVLESRSWDDEFFRQATEMVLRLSKEPSVKGMSRHLVLYGEKL